MNTVTFSFLDAVSALWRNDSLDKVEQAIRAALNPINNIDPPSINTRSIPGGSIALDVNLFVRSQEDRATGSTLHFERNRLGLTVRAIGSPTIPQCLLDLRVDIQSSWLATA